MEQVSVVIVHLAGKEMLRRCLASLPLTRLHQVVVVDNGSTDGSIQLVETLQRKYRSVVLIRNSENRGFAEANNQGLAVATGKYICFLNDDTKVTRGFLLPLLTRLKKNKVAAVQPLILFPDGSIDSVGSYLTPTGFLYHRAHRQLPTAENTQAAQVYSLKGACMLWKKTVLDKIGGFDEGYFAYFEETELCHRALNSGYQVWFEPASTIFHWGGFTSNNMPKAKIQYHNTKNRFVTYAKHLPIIDLLIIFPVHLILTMGLILQTSLKRPRLGLIMARGLAEGLVYGLLSRLKPGITRKSLSAVKKHPDLGYYQALFSSLQDYHKLW